MLRWIILIGYWIALTYVLVVPDPFSILKSADLLDKEFRVSSQGVSLVIHATCYFILTLLIRWTAFSRHVSILFRLLAIALFHAMLCEIAQFFVVNREPSIMDGLANITGMYLGYWFPKHPFQLPKRGPVHDPLY